MPRAADMLGYRTPQQFGAGQTIDRSVPMATPTGEYIPPPPTESQTQWEGALSNPSIANILYGAGETAMSVLTSPAPYLAGMVGYGYGALTGKDPKATGAQFEQAATIQPQTALGQYYLEQARDKLGALPPVVSGIPTLRLGAGAARYAGQQYALPLAEKGLTMYEQGKLTPGMNPISQMADTKLPKNDFQLAHEAAQRNAALPIEQGGYGLPANNTAMDRARAEGYDMRTYHGSTDPNIKEFDPSMSKGARQRAGIFSSESPELASTYAGNMGGTIYPLMVKSKGMAEVDAAGKNWSRITPDTIIKNADGTEVPAKDIITSLYAENTNTNDIARYARQQLNTGVKFKNISDIGAMSRWSGDVPETATNVTVFKPENIRSRFAAFDPMKKTSKDILAGTAAGAIGLSALMSESDQPEDVFSILYK